ncbi:hypothetical protein LCGC14_1501410 [marine sediment metagenome]|uniref:Uncharacterized protein n=1 Tax=marine sediment metagenome TaxID=412755 RepID=A0A0F9LJQ0_9ZZZZ
MMNLAVSGGNCLGACIVQCLVFGNCCMSAWVLSGAAVMVSRPFKDLRSSPPIEYLRDCSRGALGEFELWSLNEVANLRSEIRAAAEEILTAFCETKLLQACIERKAEGLLARWLIEYREQLVSAESGIIPVPSEQLLDPESCAVVDADAVLGLVDSGRTNVQKAG